MADYITTPSLLPISDRPRGPEYQVELKYDPTDRQVHETLWWWHIVLIGGWSAYDLRAMNGRVVTTGDTAEFSRPSATFSGMFQPVFQA